MRAVLWAILFIPFMCLPWSAQAGEFTHYEQRILEAYLAYYGRPADPPGLAYWSQRLEQEGGSLEGVISAFGVSAEFEERFGGLSNSELVTNLYHHLFGRGPDRTGHDFYVDKLNIGEWSLQRIAIAILDGRQNEDAVIIENRLEFSRFYVSGVRRGTIHSLTAIGMADIMSGIHGSEGSVDEAISIAGADGTNGGRLYSKFWATETGFDLTKSRLKNQEELDGIIGKADFFRCKQCHGWDRLGRAGGYSNRAPKTSRPNVADLDLQALSESLSMQELFEAIKTGSVTRRDLDLDLSPYDPSVDPTLGDMMPDYAQILTDEQIWDLVDYLKHEAIDTSQLYNLQLDDGTYPDRGRSFSNLGKEGNALNGTHVYAHRCAECHGPHGTAILVDGEEYTVGGHTRAKPYEDQHKVKFGHLGSEMGAVMADTPLSDIQDLFKALADDDHFPAKPVNEGHGSGGPGGSPGLPSHPHAPDM